MSVPAPRPEQLLTAREVAERLGMSIDWVTRRWQRGELPGYYLGRPGCKPVRFRWSDVEAWLTAKQRGSSVSTVRDLRAVR